MNAKWNMTFDKFMSEDEVKALRKTLEAAVIIAKSKAHQGPVRDQCIIELALGTGLRVSEIAALKLEDIDLKRGGNTLIVRHGKGDKLRQVKFSSSLKTLIQEYLEYRVSDSVYLFPSQRQDHMFPTAIQKVFKNWAKKAGLPSRYSIHSCRHYYASALLRVSKNLRLVQQQLGHSSPQTTTVYAFALDEEITEAVEKL
jgi:site-specific recombinase XerD